MKRSNREESGQLFTFGEHLEILRKMLFRIVLVLVSLGIIVFLCKEETFEIILAPRNSDFCTFQWVRHFLNTWGWDVPFEDYNIPLISTELSSQFMIHITVSCAVAIILASPYIVFELFRYISPALYENEKKNGCIALITIYILFLLGLLMSYFILMPISFRFLATYQVSDNIPNMITLDSYISTFLMLSFMIGVVFQLPVFVYFLGRLGLVRSGTLKKYRKHAFVLIMIIAAVITPPDIFTLVIVTIPIYGLYECSIWSLKHFEKTFNI